MSAPRKLRTRDHVIADLSINYVERVFLESGHSVGRQSNDYGYDLSVLTCDDKGLIEPGSLLIQIKAFRAVGPFRRCLCV